MDSALWLIQLILAGTFLVAGLIKLTQPRERLAAGYMAYMGDLTDNQAKGIGALEIMAAIGLVLPPALDIAPVIAPIAAVGLALLMVSAAQTHLRRHERAMIPINVLLGILSVFLVVMRFGPYSF